MQLVRPVLVTIHGPLAADAGNHLVRELPPLDDLLVSPALDVDPSASDWASIARLAFARPGASLVDRLAWVHLAATSSSFSGLVGAASALNEDGREFTLTILLADASEARQSEHVDQLRALDALISQTSFRASTQIYVLRRRLGNGFVLPDTDLSNYLAMAARAYIFTNITGVDANIAPTIWVPSPNDLLATKDGETHIFGRLALVRLRSPVVAAASRCADNVMSLFASSSLDRRHRIPVGWAVPDVSVAPPGVAAPAKRRIGAQLRAGPGLRFPQPPTMRRDWADEGSRLRLESRRWVDGFDSWSREVRITLVDVLREVRDNAAQERDRAANELDDLAVSIWRDIGVPAPSRYVREAMQRQARSWSEQPKPGDDRTFRRANRVDMLNEVDGLTRRLVDQLRVRPNARLMLLIGAIVTSLGILATQAIVNVIDPTRLPIPPGIDADAGTKVTLWRIVAAASVPIAVLLVIGTSLFRTRVRFDRFYTALRLAMASLLRKSADDVNREIDLVDDHWHRKTIDESRRRALELSDRMTDVDRELRPYLTLETAEAGSRTTFERLVPDAPSALESIQETALAALISSGIVRSEEFANTAVKSTKPWAPRLRAKLLDLAEAEVARQLQSPASDTRQAIQRSGKEWVKAGPTFFARPQPGESAHQERHRLALAAEQFVELATPQDGFGNTHLVPGTQDELIGLVVQMGLSPSSAAR